MNIFDHYRQRYEAAKDEEFTLQEFLTTCRQDRSAYANAAERLLMAIGEPVMVDTAQEPRLSRLFSNRVIARYPAFEEFYGMEDAIEQIVSYLKHAAQGLEEKKQILYLLGPVGGGKSSLAERLKSLMQSWSIQPRNPDFLDSFLTRSLHVIRRLKSFTAWKTRLNRLSLI